MKRPKLNQISLEVALQWIADNKQGFYISMSVGQWDKFLEEGYNHQGATLIELDRQEKPIAAYKKPLIYESSG
ncbi:MAG: hypothetical protein US86_C0003G0077 [Candidatus Daviesbacteria bacterium GW2011_GWA2_38_24]|uniref:Uncharacterized protein n=1 Tax=Candidatus Daviesbacteria bacterium GW2011_GWA2_38_24 TaxID=1618422 RepID=A0A0G0LZM7_9BACT|nr:MAG: hypothetical protein US86_C0003G0077 [Candidatus Daviesbacteria bacterium GW2011_GWA2_38_24]KKQ78304.1 MAG: hypothetical protein UT01_C0074G0004 [Candidatus Daviesbacteria bacterium GW2011_GWA1_38_7]OGE24629.1 MAG: hypothetical protein A2688_00425 [Candidatus Daviesbacteria bacterium RIFCSPHIGHO2_01_FULL_38_8]